jgi:hypothetical protein
VTELAGRADRLNQTIIKSGAEGWRPEASSIGQAIYDVLSSDRRVFADLLMARTLPIHAKDLRLQFTGPAVGLGIPFELLRTGRDNLALKHVLTRRVIQEGDSYTHRLESFRAFIEERWKAKAPLRVLIVGSNSDGKIPAAEIEADTLATAINDDLKRMGITPEITALTGERATYNEVCSALSDGRFHIFHYAGHGRFDDQLPEISGLILKDGSGGRELTANVLEQLLSDTELRLVYLSCCLGARTSSQLGRGDFYGLLDSIIRADVPVALGHRWTIADDPAKLIALFFYQELWRTFSPGEALLQARKRISSELGRDDETWASPIIVMQNAYEEMETAP